MIDFKIEAPDEPWQVGEIVYFSVPENRSLEWFPGFETEQDEWGMYRAYMVHTWEKDIKQQLEGKGYKTNVSYLQKCFYIEAWGSNDPEQVSSAEWETMCEIASQVVRKCLETELICISSRKL